MTMLSTIEQKIDQGQPLTREDALFLLRDVDLLAPRPHGG